MKKQMAEYVPKSYERMEIEVHGNLVKEIMRIELGIADGESNPIYDRRDWLLGGESCQWGYYKDPITNELVLERW